MSTGQPPIKIKSLVFDWGDTLMVNFPQYPGPMVDWPEVKAVAGAYDALKQLQGDYELVVATSALDSDSSQVRAALERVGLAGFFSQIFSRHELGSAKPAPEFFQAVQQNINRRPSELLMIGDSLEKDIFGAFKADWKSFWYNPQHMSCPGLLPLHDAEIYTMADLPAKMSSLSLPGYQTCLTWLSIQDAPPSLLSHVHNVAAAAYQMASWLSKAGENIDPILAHRGGLLHDLAKISARKAQPKRSHGEMAAQILLEYDQPVLSEIVRKHMINSYFEETCKPQTWEEKLVYFADKLVEGSQVVPFVHRLEALHHRYSMDYERYQPILSALQAEITSIIGIKYDQLIPFLNESMSEGEDLFTD